MAKAKETKVYQMKGFPADLHRRARIAAAEEGVTLKEIIIRALEEFLARRGSGR